jgi:hypothetical protein
MNPVRYSLITRTIGYDTIKEMVPLPTGEYVRWCDHDTITRCYKWVECKKQMPYKKTTYIVFYPSGDGYPSSIMIALFDGEDFLSSYVGPFEATHWMPMPSEPK